MGKTRGDGSSLVQDGLRRVGCINQANLMGFAGKHDFAEHEPLTICQGWPGFSADLFDGGCMDLPAWAGGVSGALRASLVKGSAYQ